MGKTSDVKGAAGKEKRRDKTTKPNGRKKAKGRYGVDISSEEEFDGTDEVKWVSGKESRRLAKTRALAKFTNPLKFSCPQCGMTDKQKINILIHRVRIHKDSSEECKPGERAIQAKKQKGHCLECQSSCTRAHIVTHLREKHDIELVDSKDLTTYWKAASTAQPTTSTTSSEDRGERGSQEGNGRSKYARDDDGDEIEYEEDGGHNNFRNDDRALEEMMLDDLVDKSAIKSAWSDVVGQEMAKQALDIAVILPSLRPDLFSGVDAPSRGVLLFGGPGNGKTMIVRSLAHETNATLFNISASSFSSQWWSVGERMVRILFKLAAEKQPSIIFVDEIDSMLRRRTSKEYEGSRRLKTEFLVGMDGFSSGDANVVVIGATNRPQDLDEAALRRFPVRVMLPPPDEATRAALIQSLMAKRTHSLTDKDFQEIGRMTENYSGSDLAALVKEARTNLFLKMPRELILRIKPEEMPPIGMEDLVKALNMIQPSSSPVAFKQLQKWNKTYGARAPNTYGEY